MKDCEICGNTRHVRCGKVFKRCTCIEGELKRRKVAKYTTSVAPITTDLVNRRRESLVLVGSVQKHTPHIAGVYQDSPTDFTIRTLHAYDMVSAFFGEAQSGERGLDTFVVSDLLIVLLGFSELTNKMLGDMLHHVYVSRKLKDRATWFVVPNKNFSVLKTYGEQLEKEVDQLPGLAVDGGSNVK